MSEQTKSTLNKMKVLTTVTEKKEVAKNIELPYCSKHGESFFYRINPDESILKLSLIEGGAWGTIEILEPKCCIYNTSLAHVIEAIECDESEVLECAMKIHALVEKRLESKLVAV